LREGRDEAVHVMRDIAENDASLAFDAYERLLAHADRRGDGEGVRRWGARHDRAAIAGRHAEGEAIEAVRDGRGAAPAIGDEALRFLREAARVDPCMTAAWLASVRVQLTDGRGLSGERTMHVLLLRIDTGKLHSTRDDEEAVRERYRRVLSSLLPIEERVIAMSCLTTEETPDIHSACVQVVGDDAVAQAEVVRT